MKFTGSYGSFIYTLKNVYILNQFKVEQVITNYSISKKYIKNYLKELNKYYSNL